MKYFKSFSKRLKKMGQGASHSRGGTGRGHSGATPPANYDLPPLQFHATHGENIALSPSKDTALRSDSFCKGIVFSNRPVMVGERVCIKLGELNNRWNGVLRVGFSAHDPASLTRPLPKYACPDLTSKPGYWAKALSERVVVSNTMIHYHVSGNGDVHFGIDGQDLGVFFSGVDTRTPLWALIDLYGNCTAIELVDIRKNMNNFNNADRQNTNSLVRSHSSGNSLETSPLGPGSRASPNLQQARTSQTLPRNSSSTHMPMPTNQPLLTVDLPPPNYTNTNSTNNHPYHPSAIIPPTLSNLQQDIIRPQPTLDSHFSRLSFEQNNHGQQFIQQDDFMPPPQIPSQNCQLSISTSSSSNINELRYNRGIKFRPMKFHLGCGRHAEIEDSGNGLDRDRCVASRHGEEFSQGYVFSQETIHPGERIVIQVLSTEHSYIGSLAFGLTNCDPSSIDLRELPEDSDLLLDRPEYWVVSKDVANNPDAADELSFTINTDGSVEFSKNGNMPSAFMHVDISLPLWAFWDLYGNTSKIRLVGSTKEPVVRFNNLSAPMNSTTLPSQQSLHQEQISARNNNSTVIPSIDRSPSQRTSKDTNISVASSAGTSASAIPVPDNAMNRPATTDNVLNTSFGSNSGPSECTVCYEKFIDCVLYTCGHMCMCYDCAIQQWRGRGGGFCPMCRNEIRDVIKTFRS